MSFESKIQIENYVEFDKMFNVEGKVLGILHFSIENKSTINDM